MKVKLKKLSDQVIVLTGATSGIGLTTARTAAKRGAKLVLAARNESALQQLCEELNRGGKCAVYVAADVGREDEVNQIAEHAIDQFGRIDTWVNIAGVSIFGKNEDVATEDMQRLFETNFWGVVYGSMAAVKHLKKKGGALINIGSEVSDRAIPLQGIYSASKHAVKGFTDSLRMELEEEGAPVSVTLVKPAAIDTMLVQHAKNYMEVEPKLPAPIYAPEVVADAILYAAEHSIRDIYAGGGAKLVGAGAHYMPRLLDLGMRYFMYRGQKTRHPARDRSANSLHDYQDDLLERGGVGGRTRESSLYTSAVTHPKTTRALALGAGIAAAALWQARRNAAR